MGSALERITRRPAVLPDGEPVVENPAVFFGVGEKRRRVGRVPVAGALAEMVSGWVPSFGGRIAIDQFLSEHKEVPFETPDRNVKGVPPGTLRYREWMWPSIPYSAAEWWFWAEFGLTPLDLSLARDPRWIVLPEAVFWVPDGAETVQAVLLKMLHWHDHRDIESWASTNWRLPQ